MNHANFMEALHKHIVLPDGKTQYQCPCCQSFTLSAVALYDICPVCCWEDDGQDDPDADEVWGGPNHKYSLSQARENFKRYGIMYFPKTN